MTRPHESIKNVYSLLMAGQSATLKSMFAGEPLMNTPMQGEIKGTSAFERFVQEQKAWLNERNAKPDLIATTITEERMVTEIVLYLQQEGQTIDLPVSIVADLAEGGASSVRVYYSTWPLTGQHKVRPPLLSPVEDLKEPEIIEEYMAGIRKPDKEAVLALFAEQGYVREPSGSKYKHGGKEGREKFYEMALGVGGVSLKHCTATFDGTRFAVEYICDEWGSVKFEPQPGMAVYELTDSGNLLAVRIYDDVSPPNEDAA